MVHGTASRWPRPDRAGGVAYLLLDEPNLYFADAYGIAFSPDGKRLYVSSSRRERRVGPGHGEVAGVLGLREGRIGIEDRVIAAHARNLG